MRSMAFSDVKKFVARWRKELVGLAGLVGLVCAVLFVLWQLGQVTLVAQQVTLVQILTAIVVLVGLYWTSRRVLAAEDNVRVAQETVRVAEEGHLTDRFTKAIAHLGADNMAIRLGGIYALERIAKDSEKDHGPIMEVLTAFVREHAPAQKEQNTPATSTPPPDIEAILTVLGRRETTGQHRGADRLDLFRTQLAWMILPGANLRGATLCAATLWRTDLREADLRGADLCGADLWRADLSEADLCGANLSVANLNIADLRGADLCGANLSGALLRNAILSEAVNLTAGQVQSGTDWRHAHLPEDLQYLKDPPA